ncbi:MAG: amidohydrolase family protein [Fuerstiella sp.]|nr:amidohydrolase family protein [Fuerstiella sp.]MCP4854642.1 amidohydrolase family protein [Fuerstiella sp.]
MKEEAGQFDVPRPFGLPPAEELQKYRIWDSYFLPLQSANGQRFTSDVTRSRSAIEKSAMERLCVFLHVGLGTADPATEEKLIGNPDAVLALLRQWGDTLIPMMRLNPMDVGGSLDALSRWMRDGPMVGVYFASDAQASLPCNHRNFAPLVQKIDELGGVIMQHTWFKTGGKGSVGESTPSELAELAKRFPEIEFVCAHAGGEWEKGIRAIRAYPNILAETSGFDATAGFIDMAVREIGADRIVFGSHLPSRALGTELSKVLNADISDDARKRIFGANLRRLLGPILAKNK